MKIIIDIAQQTNVHFFKNIIWELERRNHSVFIVSRERELTNQLLDVYGFKYTSISKYRPGLVNLFFELVERIIKIKKYAKIINPDVIIGRTPSTVLSARLLGLRSLIEDDDGKAAGLLYWVKRPYVDVVLCPESLPNHWGKKQISYRGSKELAYLHPDYFKPNTMIKEEIGLHNDEKLFVLRFSAMRAVHDFGKDGISMDTKRKIIKKLSNLGKVIISSEGELPIDLKEFQMKIEPHKIHDLLYCADLYLGDSQTMAAEAAILGTPSIRCSPFVGRSPHIEELENKYDLTIGIPIARQETILEKIDELLAIKNLKEYWREKHKNFFQEKVDVVKLIVNIIESMKFKNEY